MSLLPYAILSAFLLACCVVDVRTRRIPNALSGPALALGVILGGIAGGTPGVVASLAGAALIIAMLLPAFALGGIGGGDVKMMAAVGAFLGPRLALCGLLVGMTLGGVVMAVHLARLGRLGEKLVSLRHMIFSAAVLRSVEPLRMAAGDPVAISLPYSIPLALGATLVAVATAWSR